MAGLSAGLLDREIVIQKAPAVQSESGEQTFDWDHAEEEIVWAQWLPAGTTEAYRAQQRLGSNVEGVFRIYDMETRPTPNDTRILFDGRVFDTMPYVEVGRGDGLEIPVKAHGE